MRRCAWLCLIALAAPGFAGEPVRGRQGMVASADSAATRVGVEVLREGGTAVDATIAAAFALAVVHPTAGNIAGGGFLLLRRHAGEAIAYDFRETAPAGAAATMFLKDGRYDPTRHHDSALAVGVPGTVAGLHLAWTEAGKLPWRRLVEPAVALARDGFVVSDWLAQDLKAYRAAMDPYPASVAQFTKAGIAYEAGDVLKQPDLARTLERIAQDGPPGFYAGETARLIEKEMRRLGGLVSSADLAAYRPSKRVPIRGSYRGYEILSMPPPSSGGTALIEMLNVLEGYDLAASGFGAAATVHHMAEAMRRAFADRARFQGDPDFNRDIPEARLLSKEYATWLRSGIREDRASVSAPDRFEWPAESNDTTHVAVIDAQLDAVALTFTLEDDYGVKIVVPGGGFLLNNEMGDFNAGPGLTDATGLIGTEPNLAQPGKRMLSSMTPTIVSRDGHVFLALGAAGGRRIINTVLEAIVNVVDFGMNLQEAVDAPRFHHQWLPDEINVETHGLSPDTIALLRARGHRVSEGWPYPSRCQAVLVRDGLLEGAWDRRYPDGSALAVAPPSQRAAVETSSGTTSGSSATVSIR
jgi:gamma-glutamyltranspeptidase/glutathione hydrolase